MGNRTAQAAASVKAFLERTYWSIGETLPHEFLDPKCRFLVCFVVTVGLCSGIRLATECFHIPLISEQ